MNVLELSPDLELEFIGPSLDKGRLPAVFYFALSGKESLELDPYNQPALYLAKHGIRVFSLNLPYHGPNFNALDAIKAWAHEFNENRDPLTPFINQATLALDKLISRGIIFREKIGLMGLSRGGLIASLVATQFPDIRAVVGFAPMTYLSLAREFEHLRDRADVQAFNLENHVDTLYDKKIRFYIGNRDTRVWTDRCFHFIQLLAETAFQKGLRSPPVEMIISSSIGQMGHGTSKDIFEAGANWLGEKIGGIK